MNDVSKKAFRFFPEKPICIWKRFSLMDCFSTGIGCRDRSIRTVKAIYRDRGALDAQPIESTNNRTVIINRRNKSTSPQ